jgi:hypothetical protein
MKDRVGILEAVVFYELLKRSEGIYERSCTFDIPRVISLKTPNKFR